MKDPEISTVFTSINGRTDTVLPAWYVEKTQVDPDDVISFSEAVRQLPRAVETTVAYQSPYIDDYFLTYSEETAGWSELEQIDEAGSSRLTDLLLNSEEPEHHNRAGICSDYIRENMRMFRCLTSPSLVASLVDQ